MDSCAICDRVKTIRENPSLIHEFKNSFLILGDHQFFRGYCLVISKIHAREMHDLPEQTQAELLGEVMKAGKAIHQAFAPWKLNYASLGNQDPHVHWHIFPRYEADPDHRAHPWLNSAKFAQQVGSSEQRAEAIQRIRQALSG